MSINNRSSSRGADMVLSLAVIGIAIVVIMEGLKLPPSRFDPLGPGGVPIGIAVLLIVFGSWIGIAALLGRSVGGGQRMFTGLSEEDAGADEQSPLLWQRSLAVFVLTLVYVALLPLKEVEFFPATAVYMSVLLYILSDRSLKSLLFSVLLSTGFALAIDQVFRRFLLVTLP